MMVPVAWISRAFASEISTASRCSSPKMMSMKSGYSTQPVSKSGCSRRVRRDPRGRFHDADSDECHARRVARTQAVFYRDDRGAEPVDDFIEALPPNAAKIGDYIDEYLNGRRPDEPAVQAAHRSTLRRSEELSERRGALR